MVRPPLNQKRGELYDSVVDDVRDPSIFVVFDIAHSYPEYLIEYSDQPQPTAVRAPVRAVAPKPATAVKAPGNDARASANATPLAIRNTPRTSNVRPTAVKKRK